MVVLNMLSNVDSSCRKLSRLTTLLRTTQKLNVVNAIDKAVKQRVKDFWSLWNRIAIVEGDIKPDLMEVEFSASWSVHIMGRLLVKGSGSGRGSASGSGSRSHSRSQSRSQLLLRRLSTR
jgi:hypothetical protein